MKLLELTRPDLRLCNEIDSSLRLIPRGSLEGKEGGVTIEAFLMKNAPITNSEYRVFTRAIDYQTSAERRESDATWRKYAIDRDAHPVLFLDWEDAYAYCLWQTRRTEKYWRLPSRYEWQWAARGGLAGRSYPWGDEDPDGRCAAFRDQLEISTMPVSSFEPNGYMLYDVVGNVWKYGQDIITGEDSTVLIERYGAAGNVRRNFRLKVRTVGVLEYGLTNINTGFCPVISVPLAGSFREEVERAFVRLLRAMTPDGGGAYLRIDEDRQHVSIQLVGTCVRCTKQRESGQDLVASLQREVPSIKSCASWLVKGQRIVQLDN